MQVRVTSQQQGEPVSPNKWLVVVAACHALLEVNCGVKVAMDANEDKFFVLCKEASHAARLDFEALIDVNQRYSVFFFQKDVLQLYMEDADQVHGFSIRRAIRGQGNKDLLGHKRTL